MIGTQDQEGEAPWDQLRELYRLHPHLVAAAAILSAALLPFLAGERLEILVVLAILAAQVTLRGVYDRRFQRRRPGDAFSLWLRRFVMISVLSGIAWGLSLAILYAGAEPQAQVIVLAVGCGIVQSAAARAYMAPAPTMLVILIMMGFVNYTAFAEGQWVMLPICLAYIVFQASYMKRLISLHEGRSAAERRTANVLDELAESNEKLRAANERLTRYALTDGLTGLANRRVFDQHLASRITTASAERRPLSLLLLDVDHFKLFNDTHGHQAGDECLRLVAAVLRDACEEHDYRPARYGGEEFAIVMPDAEIDEAMAFAHRLRAMAAELSLRDVTTQRASVTISIGVSSLGEDPAEDAASLLERADLGLYRAKQAGRNAVMTVEGDGARTAAE